MKIATWNVNSMKVRLPQVLEWLSANEPDVLVLQEIKQLTEMFPTEELAAAGYRSLANGQKTYNGVAVVSKEEPRDPALELPGLDDPQRRVLATTLGDVRVINLYVPNGSEVGSEKYAYKLGWLRALRDYLADELQQHENLVVLGDFNIAPADEDVYDPEKWGDAILCSPAERAALGDVRVINLYVPNGSEVGSEKYAYKLGWLRALRDYLADELQQHENLVVLGDFNIAPADEDVYDPEKWGDAILCSPAERAALAEVLDIGLTDVFRKFEQPDKSFSWWDYRAAMFRRNAGLRIDLILTSAAMTERCTASYIDREPRTWERPSDHAPVIAEFAD